MKDKKIIAIVILSGVILVLLLIMGSSEDDNPSMATTTNSNTINELTEETHSIAPSVDLSTKSKCASDGVSYLDSYAEGHKTEDSETWFPAEYHYNSSLDSCLAYISYNTVLLTDSPVYPEGSEELIENSNVVMDIYENKALLQSDTDRTYTTINGQETESDELDKYPEYQYISNINAQNFNVQLKDLMNN